MPRRKSSRKAGKPASRAKPTSPRLDAQPLEPQKSRRAIGLYLAALLPFDGGTVADRRARSFARGKKKKTPSDSLHEVGIVQNW